MSELSWPICESHQRRLSRRHGSWYCEACVKGTKVMKPLPTLTPKSTLADDEPTAPGPYADLPAEKRAAREKYGPACYEAVLAERERCARIAEGGSFLHPDAPDARFGKAVAEAIRRQRP